MSQLLGGSLGPEADYDLEVAGGKLTLKGKYHGQGGAVELALSLDAGYFLDALAKKIPGQVDDAVFSVLKAALAVS